MDRRNSTGAWSTAEGPGDEPHWCGHVPATSRIGASGHVPVARRPGEKRNTPRKIATTHGFDDVILQRGVIGSPDLWAWLDEAARGIAATRQVTIELLDEARNTVVTWALRNAQPKKWTGPTLAAKGGSVVAMEELVITHEGIEYS